MTELPVELLRSLDGVPGFDRGAFEAVHAGGAQVTSIRVNPGKWGDMRNGGLGAGAERVPWSSWGRYLVERPSFTFDPTFHAGAYYVQEASGMFLEEAMRQTVDLSRPLRVLDLCAAPGGKSTLLQSLLSGDSLLVSNEVIRNRAGILEENITKWGGMNVVVTSNDPRDLGRLENYFDVIVVDAPCSGSGLFRREPEAVGEWSLDNVRLCHQRQQRILADIWPALRQDGLLIYSTCSYSREENEDIVAWMIGDLGAAGCRLGVPVEWGIVETESGSGTSGGSGGTGAYGYRFYPNRLRGEGFFMACVRKTAGGTSAAPRKKNSVEKVPRKVVEGLNGWVRREAGMGYFYHQELIHAIPEVLLAELPGLQSACYLKRAGVPIGKFSVKEFIPEHDLAMSGIVDPQMPAMVVSKEKALNYLRRDVVVQEGEYRGWMLVQYAGLNLGWIKVLPGRINNYYPKEWRILRRDP